MRAFRRSSHIPRRRFDARRFLRRLTNLSSMPAPRPWPRDQHRLLCGVSTLLVAVSKETILQILVATSVAAATIENEIEIVANIQLLVSSISVSLFRTKLLSLQRSTTLLLELPQHTTKSCELGTVPAPK